jgi:hypothetical protein
MLKFCSAKKGTPTTGFALQTVSSKLCNPPWVMKSITFGWAIYMLYNMLNI